MYIYIFIKFGSPSLCLYLCSVWLFQTEEEGEKTGLKLNIKKTKIIVSGPVTSRQIEEGKVEAMTDFLLLSSQITVVGDCSHKIRSHLLLERKAMANLDSILKSRDITLPIKVHIDKAVV